MQGVGEGGINNGRGCCLGQNRERSEEQAWKGGMGAGEDDLIIPEESYYRMPALEH